MTLLPIKGDLLCHSDALRMSVADGWQGRLLLLSMIGPRNAVRAAWATLTKTTRKGWQERITVGDQTVMKDATMAYVTTSAQIERGILHCVIFHQQFDRNAPDLGYFYQAGPNAEQRYLDRLARWCPVPMRETWRNALWDLGRKHHAIVEMPGHGRAVWWVSTTRESWEPIVSGALASGELR